MARVFLMVMFLMLGSIPLFASEIVQLVNNRKDLHPEEAYLAQSLQTALGQAPKPIEANLLSRNLPKARFAFCRMGVRPDEYYRYRPLLKKWIADGGVLWLEHGGVYMLKELEIGYVSFPEFLPAVSDEVYHLAMAPTDGIEGPPGIGTPLIVAARTEEWLFGRVVKPGIYGYPMPVVDNAIRHHTENLLHTPNYNGWVPKELCAKYPGFCAKDFAVLSTKEHSHFFPHQPMLIEIPYGRGRIYVYHLPFSLEVFQPGPAAERLRGAWARWAIERPTPESVILPKPTPVPPRATQVVAPRDRSRDEPAPNIAKPTGTATVTPTAPHGIQFRFD